MSFAPRGEMTTYVDGGAGAALLLGALAIVTAGVVVTIVSVVALRSRPRPPRHASPAAAAHPLGHEVDPGL
ncbi:hypothetical protein [Demequina sp. NBRC 110054]|uniref:hypothetical protein n=1 Tax=Demequina sp. NBRC 110054 TaxID=1570343 RepID=UPI000A01F03C|nr:hypothetical protein [Demequina sp. NBRC 110054]